MGMTYYTKENEVLDYICWKYYFQPRMNSSLLEQETIIYGEASNMMEMFDFGWLREDDDQKLNKILSKVIEANPGLVNYGLFLPSNIRIELPDLKLDDDGETMLQLWD